MHMHMDQDVSTLKELVACRLRQFTHPESSFSNVCVMVVPQTICKAEVKRRAG